MLKIIHSKFQLDLSNYNISIVEENIWFSDRFFTNFVLPFNFKITDELNAALGDLLSYNSEDADTYFEVRFYHNGEEHEAVFEIEEFEGRDASGSIAFGLEELPNYNKKLSELDLDDFEILNPETIYSHASNLINKTWPEVTHNFVQVHTDKFSSDEAQWEAFEGVINKRVGGNFVVNEYDAVEDKQLNRNIMIPQPYQLYVLQKAIEDAGYVLAGDILNNAAFKKALFSEISSYYHSINTESEELFMHSGEHHQTSNSGAFGNYSKTLVLTEKGRYKISGNLTMRKLIKKVNERVKFNGKTIWKKNRVSSNQGSFGLRGYEVFTSQININVDFTEGDETTIEYSSSQFVKGYLNKEFLDDQPICDLSITQLSKLDANGNLEPTLITPNNIKLTKCVPDITVGDFITAIKNWFNVDLNIDGNKMYFNYIENQLKISSSKSLEDFEERYPQRLSTKGKSFLLKFQSVSSEEYTFLETYVDYKGAIASGIEKSDDTSEIVINAIPLPIINREGIITAHHFLEDTSKIKTILYEGALAIENIAQDPSDILIPAIYDNHYLEWFNFRIYGKNFKWSFKMYEEQLRDLKIRNKVFAYNNHHIIKSLNKDLLVPGVWLIEIETESLKHIIE